MSMVIFGHFFVEFSTALTFRRLGYKIDFGHIVLLFS